MRKSLVLLLGLQACIPGYVEFSKASEREKLEGLVAANTAAVTGIGSLKVRISNRYIGYPESDVDYTYVFTGEKELWDITPVNRETKVGEFTNLVYSLGRREVSNGPEGFRSVANRDEIRDENGRVPLDSPMSAVIDARKPGIVELPARCHLGMAILQPEPRRQWQVAELFSECDSSGLIATPDDQQSDGCWVLEFVVPEGSHRVWLDPRFGNMISRSKWTGSTFAITVDFLDFRPYTRDVFLPSSFRVNQTGENGHRLAMTGNITPISVNERLPESAVTVSLPEGVPFYDAMTGKAGIWGDSGPQIIFSSAEESSKWDTARKVSYRPVPRPLSGGATLRLWLLLSSTVLLLAIAFRLLYVKWRRNA